MSEKEKSVIGFVGVPNMDNVYLWMGGWTKHEDRGEVGGSPNWVSHAIHLKT